MQMEYRTIMLVDQFEGLKELNKLSTHKGGGEKEAPLFTTLTF